MTTYTFSSQSSLVCHSEAPEDNDIEESSEKPLTSRGRDRRLGPQLQLSFGDSVITNGHLFRLKTTEFLIEKSPGIVFS